ncbi:branched-chain amino acid ABC transporter permease [Candidatus Synechococcus calcipolaris G9]|uniref:Branched-chain amino acid ABC transporter permease n=1 Tax=Candidatus Synechococcus calcipolaris G9 TaxID=1497997 RepID=A0ABT6F013_9SYNE|nr:branched-chain amino acid ABC transporter permease [Candidatus Synechococcus calcipolaris]MDG2991156.1 branched-chain amino acid ABC transporter permease [Candidatus Synechococcus calcipolaris G9]
MADFFNTYGFLLVSMTLGAMLGLSLYLPLMAGQLSLASPGFYALGGYVAAIISTRVPTTAGELYPLGWVILEVLLAGALSALLGLGLGIPVLRLRGIYLAIATIAFGEVLRVLALNLELTGGAIGIFGIPQPFRHSIEYLWLSLPLLVLSMVFLYRLETMRAGRAMDAIRTDELAATCLGINPMVYKVLAFTLGAILAGMVGAVSAHFLNTWNPRQGTFDAGILYLTAVLIGGNRTFLGPVLGGMIFTALPEVLRAIADQPGLPQGLASFFRDGRLILYGVLIVLGSLFFPYGLVQRSTARRWLDTLVRLSISFSKGLLKLGRWKEQ